jgi:hypothetical protein
MARGSGIHPGVWRRNQPGSGAMTTCPHLDYSGEGFWTIRDNHFHEILLLKVRGHGKLRQRRSRQA